MPVKKTNTRRKVVKQTFFTRVKNWFTYDRILLIIAVIALLLVATCNIQKKNALINAQQGKLDSLRDANGNAHARGQIRVVSAEEMKHITDSIAQVIGTKTNTIIKYVETNAGVNTNVTANRSVITVYDTIYLPSGGIEIKPSKAFLIDYHDPTNPNWLSIRGIVPSNPQTFNVKLQAKLTYTDYTKKTGFLGLGKKTYYTDIGTDNPYITFTGGTTIVKEVKPTWKVRPGFGVGINYDPFAKRFSPGVQAGIYLFKSK